MRREQTNESLGSGLPGIAGILLIVAAGGGFKQLLVDAGVANVIADWATGANISVLLLGWLVAVGIRLGVPATGRRFEDVDEIYVFRVENGKLVAAYGVEDNLSRLRQLGIGFTTT